MNHLNTHRHLLSCSLNDHNIISRKMMMMNHLFFDNNNISLGFCMANEDDVWYHLNGLMEDYSSIIAFSPLNDFPVAVDFQDHLGPDLDLDIITATAGTNTDYLMDSILDDEILIGSATSNHVSSDHETMPLPPAVAPVPSSLVFLPGTEDILDNELSVIHLLMAYTEAMEMGQEELAEVIGKRISYRVSPVGDTIWERLMYYMFQTLEDNHNINSNKQCSDYYYLKQESVKNFCPAFMVFYQMFPNGKFAHFLANFAILEALPNDISVIRIFDFDIGEGIQWASLIRAAIINNGQEEKIIRQIIISSVKQMNEGDQCNSLQLPIPKFEDTKRRLRDYAMSYGLELKVEEIELRDLGRCLISTSKNEWLVFNCMVGLPHMGRVRSRKNVVEFLESAQNFLQQRYNSDHEYRAAGGGGIVILGEGDGTARENANATNYGEFLEGKMGHYQALLESIEHNFPIHLGEARTAMECLFVAPFMSSRRWAKQWEEEKKYGKVELLMVRRMEGWKLSQDRIMETMELVRLSQGESSLYGVRIMECERNNEIVMDWRGIPMVKLSCWRSN